MKFFRFCFIICFIDLVITQVESTNNEIHTEGGVIILTDDNFKRVVNEIDDILVAFYTPNCDLCDVLVPELEKTAKALMEKESSVFLAKLDSKVHTKVTSQFQVETYPTLKYFKNGKPSNYEGPIEALEADGILAWIEKNSQSPVKKINSLKDMENKIKAENVIVVGFFTEETSGNAVTYLNAATEYSDITFYATNDPKIMEYYNKKEGDIAILKTFEEEEVSFVGDSTEENLIKFIKLNSFPLVSNFSDQHLPEIFGSHIKSHLLIISNTADDEHAKRIEEAREAAKLYRDVIMFVHLDTAKKENVNYLEFFGITVQECPTILIYNVEKSAKYLPTDKSINRQNLGQAVEDYLSGKLVKSLKSSPVPQDWDAKPVKVLVTANFHKIAKDKLQDVFVMFYAPWCDLCKTISPQWDELGERYKDRSDKIIAKMDATANEIDQVVIEGFPTIALFKKQSNQIVIYKGKQNLESFVNFLETGEQDVNDDGNYLEQEGVEIATEKIFSKDVDTKNNNQDEKTMPPKEEL